MCKELQPRRISVNNIAPGPMDTRKSPTTITTTNNNTARRLTQPAFFYPQESPEAVAFHKANGLDGRLTDVKDIAPIVKFLCTDGAWITGQTIFANGGYTTR